MEPCKSIFVRTGLFFLFLLAASTAYGQRGTLDIDAGAVSDEFGSQPKVTAAEFGLNGQFALIQANKDGRPSIVLGGELRLPSDTSTHATEFAVFGGPIFPIGNFSIGVNAEVRRIYLPPAQVNGTTLDRFNMGLLELPVILRYKFGPGKRVFVEARGEPEFTPHFSASSSTKASLEGVPHPNFDYGYTVRGTLGYIVGKWYVKGAYETRYFKFIDNQNNPLGLYNWRSNNITGGVGLIF